MIGVDTNVLLRVFIDDDPEQVAAARKLVSSAEPDQLLISIIVLVEFIWTLRSTFKVEKADLVAALDGVLTRAAFVIEDRSELKSAVQRLKSDNVDIADYLIAARNRRLGVSHTVSFDRTAIRNSLFSPLEP